MALRGHLLFTIPFPEPTATLEQLRAAHPELTITYHHLVRDGDKQAVPPALYQNVTILCTLWDFPEPAQVPKLQLLYIVSAGSDHIQHLPLYKEARFPITTASGIHGAIISEWVLMVMLSASHRFPLMHSWQQARNWPTGPEARTSLTGVTDRVGQRLGILGYGSIGRQVARVVQTLGMDVVAFTAHPRHTPAQRRDHGYVIPGLPSDPEGSIPSAWFAGFNDSASLHKFLAYDLDVLLVCVPLTELTRGLLGPDEFKILERRNTMVINVARGEIVDQEALISALHRFDSAKPTRGHGLSGAAVDVAVPEPLPADHPLWDAPNVIITPHMSGMNNKYAGRVLNLLDQNLQRLAAGQPLLNVVDKQMGYASKATV